MGQEIIPIEQDILYPVVLCDERSYSDAICVHSNDYGEKLIAQHMAKWYHAHKHVMKKPPWVVINGTTQEQWGKQGIEFGGCEMWRDLLLKAGVRGEYILTTNTALHTGMEADEFVRIAKERGWKVVTDIALPFHILRCFLTIIKATEKARHFIDVYNLSLPTLSWMRQAPRVVLGGGFEEGTHIDRIVGEHKRIKDYTAKGFCATRDEALAYLAKRGKSDDINAK